jgi:adenylate kinase family enzyme
VTNEAKELEGEFGDELRAKLAEIKEKMIEELEAEKKKKKKKEEIDYNAIVPRFPPDMLLKAYKFKLASSGCINKGYVLDGFPRTYEDALMLFTSTYISLKPILILS